MSQKQINEKLRLETTLEIMTKFRTVWTGIPVLNQGVTQLHSLDKQIETSLSELNPKQFELGHKLLLTKRELTKNIDIVCGLLNSLQRLSKENTTNPIFEKNQHQIYQLPTNDFVYFTNQVLEEAIANKESLLENYGIQEVRITTISSLLLQYSELQKALSINTTVSEKNNKKVNQLLQEAQQIIKLQIDPVIKLFSNREPHFYNSYLVAKTDCNNCEPQV